MALRVVAIPLFAAICLASPAIASAEQAKKGRGYSPRGGGSGVTCSVNNAAAAGQLSGASEEIAAASLDLAPSAAGGAHVSHAVARPDPVAAVRAAWYFWAGYEAEHAARDSFQPSRRRR